MRILVLGSEGQIGKPLCKFLAHKGHEVIEWDKENTLKEDLANPKCFRDLILAMQRVDKVIFLAFRVGGSKYLAKVDKEFSNLQENVFLMAHTFKALAITRKPFLFSSSQMANMHHTNYGFLKDLGERYTRSLGGWICRFWNVYGVEECEEEKTHVITDFIRKAREGNIHMRTTGEEARQFLHVDDCNAAIGTWVDDLWDDSQQYYDITSFKWVSIREVADTIKNLIGDVSITSDNATDQIQKGIRNQPSNYVRRFWEPVISLEEGIAKVARSIG